MRIQVRFRCLDAYFSFSYLVNSPNARDALGSISAQLEDFCNSEGLNFDAVTSISSHFSKI